MLKLPNFDDVCAAARRLDGHAHCTPVMTSRTVNQELGAEVFFKCENLQRMGAFKFRGAFNALSKLDQKQRSAGVVTFSSGNHAQAIALSARLLGMPATIVMPSDAPASKVAATKGYGGNVVIYDRYQDDREQVGRDLADRHGLTLIPPYDHPDVIAGQGTAAKELLEEVAALDALFVSLVVVASLQARPWLPGRWHPTANFTGLSQRPATTGNNHFAQVPSCISRRPRQSPTAPKPSTLATTLFRLSSATSMTF